jgi:CRISPR-associated protein Cas2
MPRPKKVNYTPDEQLRMRLAAGLPELDETIVEPDREELPLLGERIRSLLSFVRRPADNPYDMLFLVMYDITDNRVRRLVADYLVAKGCMRIQQSVYLARTTGRIFREINESLREVQASYDNHDSILLIPVQASTVGSMKVIGKDVAIDSILDPPTTLFY